MTRPFDFSQLPGGGITILPPVPPNPNVGDVLSVQAITAGAVQLRYAAPGGAAGSFLPLAGGTLTGPLTLAGPPTLTLHAATKAYADTIVSNALVTASTTYLPLIGGTLTGPLLLNTDPTLDPHATTKKYVDWNISSVAAAGATAIYYSARTTVQTETDPGSGHVAWNVPASPPGLGTAVQLYIHGTSSQSVDWTNFWAALEVGQRIVIQDRNDHSSVVRYLIAGPIVVHGTGSNAWLTIPVTPYGPLMTVSWVNNHSLIVGVVGIAADNQWVPIEQARNTARLQAQWVSGATVANSTVYLAYDAPYAGKITALTKFAGAGSFTVAVQINGTSVTGLSSVPVNSATPSTVNATAANTFAAGARITAQITAATGSPTDALLSLAVTWN